MERTANYLGLIILFCCVFKVLEIPIVYEVSEEGIEGSPEAEYPPRPSLGSTYRTESSDGDPKKVSIEI